MNSLFSKAFRMTEGHKASNSMGTGGSFFACKAAGHKVDSTSPSKAGIEPQHVHSPHLHRVHWDNFTVM